MPRPIVVKLGGSLAGAAGLDELLRVLSAPRPAAPLVVVPGGGPFADTVRTTQAACGFSDHAAHAMALLAMAQYGLFLADRSPAPWLPCWGEAAVRAALPWGKSAPLLWLPQPDSDALTLAASWQVTSDSLALWLASRLQACRLVLVKSCPQPADETLPALAAAGIVDAAFADLAASSPLLPVSLVYNGAACGLRDVLTAAM